MFSPEQGGVGSVELLRPLSLGTDISLPQHHVGPVPFGDGGVCKGQRGTGHFTGGQEGPGAGNHAGWGLWNAAPVFLSTLLL